MEISPLSLSMVPGPYHCDTVNGSITENIALRLMDELRLGK